ncbi:hypothetical protein QNI19_02255 [Cytophagaceae bacterium DM2B3-1]|uniref:S9 family peptidase n=1 Tax=Xanthocytophaga flava TaxID=3048013 RepID=A0ABT7CFG8_9BACT|nr:hypothetical protein [Xanthocytophaga flavus]MDJ1491735.1 hypothetical protein [Xanthocytophaga flavus]
MIQKQLYTGLLFIYTILSVQGQELEAPLPQKPFRWEDFSVQKHYTTLKVNHKTIDSVQISPMQSGPDKATVRQSFQNAVLSGQPRLYPFEYQYNVVSSPDKKLYLVYRYDYSQPQLQTSFKILNASFSVQQSFSLPVDNGTTSHGYWIDNKGDVYAVYTESDDAIYVMRYQPQTQSSDLLEVGADVTRRNRFVLIPESDGTVFLANIAEDMEHNWKGIMFTTFDFRDKRIQNLFFFPAETLQDKLSKKLSDGHYEIIDAKVSGSEKTVVLQKVAIQGNRYVYDPFAGNDPMQWISRKQQVQYGEKITVTIGSENRILQKKVEDVFLTKER